METFTINQEKKLNAYTTIRALLLIEVDTVKEADKMTMNLLSLTEQYSYLLARCSQTRDEEERDLLFSIARTVDNELKRTLEQYRLYNSVANSAVYEVVTLYKMQAVDISVEEEE